MVIGIIVDFLVLFLICFIVYKNLYFNERPSFKMILKSILIGFIELAISVLIILVIMSVYQSVQDYLLWTDFFFIPILPNRVGRMLVLFLLVEEGVRYLVVKTLIEREKFKFKSPLQTVLIFLIIGSVLTFAIDVATIIIAGPTFFLFGFLLSKHLISALIQSHYFSKYILQLRSKNIMNEYDSELKRSLCCSNIYTVKHRYLFKGFCLNLLFRVGHTFMVVLMFLLNVFGFTLYVGHIIALFIIFVVRIYKMHNFDVPYDVLAQETIYNDFPALYVYFQKKNNVND